MVEASVIIVNWKLADYTIHCVESVLKQQGDFEIIVVDNGSGDGSVELFKKSFGENPKVKIVDTGNNLGYTGGNNVGIQHAKGKYIVILNNDTVVEPEWLEELLKPLRNDPTVAAVNSLEVRAGKRLSIDLYKEYEFKQNILQYGVKIKRAQPLEDVTLIDSASIRGCSFAYKRELADPPFDADYFMYAEESKLAWLLKIQGYKIRLATKSVVNHFHSVGKKTNKKFARYTIFLGERNRIMNMLTFYEPITTAKILPFLFAQILVTNITKPLQIPYRLWAYGWLVSHILLIFRKRKEIKTVRKLHDQEVLGQGSWKLWPPASLEYK